MRYSVHRGYFDYRYHRDRNRRKYSDLKRWVIPAIVGEERRPKKPLWENAPTAEWAFNERLRRIKWLRKYSKIYPRLKRIADRLASCEVDNRCGSGACPECGRLFQRWFVRAVKKFIAKYLHNAGEELIALNIVAEKSIVEPGQLSNFSIIDIQRRLKFLLNKTDVNFAIGGVDFSFNEDGDGRLEQFWCPHSYLITSTADRNQLSRQLRKLLKPSKEVPRPKMIKSFSNNAYRRSYALKINFYRRIGRIQIKTNKDGKQRKCRNTSGRRLRVKELLELFLYLDQIGLAARVIFRGARPRMKNGKMSIGRC